MVEAGNAAASAAKEEVPLAGAGETILVVDDNPEVRRAVVAQLRGLGYEVLEADGANSALAIIEDGRRIDLLLTDIVMPGINGKQLATLARVRQPELRILFTSGFPGAFAKQDSQLEPDDMLLSKPYRREDLARAVRETLTATAAPPRQTA
jgi:CheY-like chemotaxis protein